MAANTRARTSLRAQLAVESLEGRDVPAIGIVHPPVAAPAVLTPINAAPAAAPAGVRVVSQVIVNGTTVLKVAGGVQFAGIGPAASGDQTGQIQTGGTTLFANGAAIGTFQGAPQVARDVSVVLNKHGQPVKVVTYRVTGTPSVAPATALTDWPTNGLGGVWVG